jgi:integrase/recombinase XerC
VLGKGGKERIIPLIPKARSVVEDYIKSSPIALLPDYPLFVEERRDNLTYKPIRLSPRKVQKIMQNQRHIKGLPKFASPHSLRHSFATHIISNGGDLRSMQELLGHASLSTTQKYVKIDAKTLESAYSKFHPKGDL